MEKKNYYAVLGVSRTESPTGIRAAFRKLAKTHHPDLSGHEKTRSFQEITEAYCVLSDPDSRELYDRALREEDSRGSRGAGQSRRSVQNRGALRNSDFPMPRSQRRTGRLSPLDVFDAFFSDWFREPYRAGSPGLHEIEVVLNVDEALRGIVLPLTIPLRIACPGCGGSGHRGLFTCLHCRGQGSLHIQKSIRITIPPQAEDGSVLEVPIHRVDSDMQVLRMHIRVDSKS